MTLDTIIMLTGGAIAVLPFLGFPTSWDDILFFLLGMLVVVLGIAVRRNAHHALMEKRQNNKPLPEAFVQNDHTPPNAAPEKISS